MRQNLTNVKETQLDKVDSFYIVGSTTKEGLIEGRSNVKIDLKKAVAEGSGGGSEEAQELFELLFGQTPYVAINDNGTITGPIPFTEYLSNRSQYLGNYPNLLFRQPSPAGLLTIEGMDGDGTLTMRLSTRTYVLEKTPEGMEIPNGPWYYPSSAAEDIDLSDFALPTSGNPTILTGVEIPQKEELTVNQGGYVVTYYWNSGGNQYEYGSPAGFYTITYSEDSWVWSFSERVISQ